MLKTHCLRDGGYRHTDFGIDDAFVVVLFGMHPLIHTRFVI